MSSSSSSVSARRRVCTACQTAKRRCDQLLPRCTQCVRRGLQVCVYPQFDVRNSREATEQPLEISNFTAVLPGSSPICPVPVVTGAVDPWPLFFNASGPANTAISRPAMDWGMAQLSTFPMHWVTDGLCPFINPSLYGTTLPQSLQDAYAVCAAYSMKNMSNASLVLGIVESKAMGLVYSPDQISWNPLQQLAALQALVMYQLIRWFDGDIRQRALADQAESVLDSWMTALQARVGQRLFERDQEANL
ncbi:hypothetical protein BJ170DRAFT_457465 [Xylariales sp. AK1849]|nr:hypothetical protein BJ170DRAFT_457465 [Xylariales sp. AK1849]